MKNTGKNSYSQYYFQAEEKNIHVLAVDDDALILQMLEAILKNYCEISISNSPLEALEMMRSVSYDILITDLRMDEMNGIELIKAAKEIHPALISIVISGYATKDIAIQAVKYGVFDILEKPFSVYMVLKCLNRAFNMRRAAEENSRLLKDLQETNKLLELSRAELEQRVEQRTAELKRLNQELAQELAHRKEIEKRIQEALYLKQKIIAASQVGIIAYKATGECVLANMASVAILNKPHEEILSMNFRTDPLWCDSELLSAADMVLNSGTEQQLEIQLSNHSLPFIWLDCRLAAFTLKDTQHLLMVVDNVTRRKEAQAKINHIALHDPLTELPNRILFFDRLSHALSRAKRYQCMVALLYIDLDDFKPINDNYGHIVGDRFLKTIAERLKKGIRESDTVARLGGDEFAAILQDVTSRTDIDIVARRLVHIMSQPVFINQHDSVESAISIGIAIYPQDGTDTETLLFKADAAMYWVKHQGKGKYCLYEEIEKHQTQSNFMNDKQPSVEYS